MIRLFRSVNYFLNRNSLVQFSTRLKYSEKIQEHFRDPQNTGVLDDESDNVGTGISGAPACGDVMQFQIEVDENEVIVDAKFKAFGCGSAIASSSYATQLVIGKTIDEVLEVKNSDIAEDLSLPPMKVHCSVLAENAIKQAVYQYREKQKILRQEEEEERNEKEDDL